MEGNFRRTCESVMRVLRENKDSVMAVLEAFVYDPLLNWRLIDGKARPAGLQASWLKILGLVKNINESSYPGFFMFSMRRISAAHSK